MKQTINKVTLIGLGAMGSYFVPRLHDYLGDNFRILATGERKTRLESTGVTINDKTYLLPIIEPTTIGDEADLIIMAVKDLGLDQAILDIKNQIGPHTQIICVMNGIDSEERLIAAYGANHVLYSFMRVSIVMKDGVTNYNPKLGSLYFGEAKNEEVPTDRVAVICELFENSGIRHHVSGDMLYSMWMKFMCNIGENLTCALLGVPFGAFQKSKHANFIRINAMREVIAIANKLDIPLSEKDIEKQEKHIPMLPFENKPSTLQDLEGNKKTEIEMFAGRVIQLGKELGVPTPINEILYHGIKTLEEKPFIQ